MHGLATPTCSQIRRAARKLGRVQRAREQTSNSTLVCHLELFICHSHTGNRGIRLRPHRPHRRSFVLPLGFELEGGGGGWAAMHPLLLCPHPQRTPRTTRKGCFGPHSPRRRISPSAKRRIRIYPSTVGPQYLQCARPPPNACSARPIIALSAVSLVRSRWRSC